MKRWWGIRHIRYWWNAYKLDKWVDECRAVGLGLAANPADEEHLRRIWEGRA